MMVVSLMDIAAVVRDVGGGEDRAERAEKLAQSIDDGIHRHAVIEDAEFGNVYAYEVDACGNALLMDDANIPSLLSMPYFGYSSPHDPNRTIQENTRRFVLSPKNPFFYVGANGHQGIGSPHTPSGNIWHLSLIMQALTSVDDNEFRRMLDTLQQTATNDLMHESFDANYPGTFTRTSFAWANSLFAELISTRLDDILRIIAMTDKDPAAT